ncbi:MAG: thioesterase family protein [Bacteroidales bacterium]|nr:thioesterase family protein [Bacteroidales bacterium]
MFSFEHQFRVLYGHTDNMGVVYYGTYPLYYECGRTEMIRSIGLTYRQLEESGTLMPVKSMNISYHASARYDDLLTLKVTLREMPSVRITFHYEIFNEEGVLINEAETMLVFVDAKTFHPCRPPKVLMEKLSPYF